MSDQRSIVLATGNSHKLEEVTQKLEPLGVKVFSLKDRGLELPEPVEDQDSFEGNAVLKARYYAEALGAMVLADDSGLAVDLLGGAPGIYSARYAGVSGSRAEVDQANNQKLVEEVKSYQQEERTARFVCALALCSPTETLVVLRGEVEGQILLEPKGDNGFGYDPYFYLPEYEMTTAQMPPEQKNTISHRGRALDQLLAWMREHYWA